MARASNLPAEDYWNPRRQWLVGGIVSALFCLAAMSCFPIFEKQAQQMGLPNLEQGTPAGSRAAIGVLLFGLLGFVVLHECGHALAAWMVGFRVKAISVGPGSTRQPSGWKNPPCCSLPKRPDVSSTTPNAWKKRAYPKKPLDSDSPLGVTVRR